MSGWIKIHRDIREHWIWQDPIKLKCWMDILFTVNFEDKKVVIGNTLFECKRGQSLLSLQSWSDRWRMSKSAARNILNLLESDGMIRTESIVKSTRLTVCKYDDYQCVTHDTETQSIPQKNRNKNAGHTQLKNDKNEKNNSNVGLQATTTSIPDSFEVKCQNFVNYFNSQKNSKYQVTDKVRKAFKKAINNYSKEDLKNVIAAALNDRYHRENNLVWVTPELVLRTEVIERFKNIKPMERTLNH